VDTKKLKPKSGPEDFVLDLELFDQMAQRMRYPETKPQRNGSITG
jgi:hypothetical protein